MNPNSSYRYVTRQLAFGTTKCRWWSSPWHSKEEDTYVLHPKRRVRTRDPTSRWQIGRRRRFRSSFSDTLFCDVSTLWHTVPRRREARPVLRIFITTQGRDERRGKRQLVSRLRLMESTRVSPVESVHVWTDENCIRYVENRSSLILDTRGHQLRSAALPSTLSAIDSVHVFGFGHVATRSYESRSRLTDHLRTFYGHFISPDRCLADLFWHDVDWYNVESSNVRA